MLGGLRLAETMSMFAAWLAGMTRLPKTSAGANGNPEYLAGLECESLRNNHCK